MSAINSNSDDRDLDAIRRAQRAYEPSMEEILASIRNIIAEEREPAINVAARPAPQPLAPAAPQVGPNASVPNRRRARIRPRRRLYGAARSMRIPKPPSTRTRATTSRFCRPRRTRR
jgi:hypothetical protein